MKTYRLRLVCGSSERRLVFQGPAGAGAQVREVSERVSDLALDGASLDDTLQLMVQTMRGIGLTPVAA